MQPHTAIPPTCPDFASCPLAARDSLARDTPAIVKMFHGQAVTLGAKSGPVAFWGIEIIVLSNYCHVRSYRVACCDIPWRISYDISQCSEGVSVDSVVCRAFSLGKRYRQV